MIEFYPQVKAVHVHAVIASGALFALRGTLMLARSRWTNHAALRYPSYAIDSVLLTAALMLATMLHQYPFVHGWLTVKVLLLVVFIVLGSLALKRGRTRAQQVTCFFAALAIYGFMYSVARAHHPLGIFHAQPWLSAAKPGIDGHFPGFRCAQPGLQGHRALVVSSLDLSQHADRPAAVV